MCLMDGIKVNSSLTYLSLEGSLTPFSNVFCFIVKVASLKKEG